MRAWATHQVMLKRCWSSRMGAVLEWVGKERNDEYQLHLKASHSGSCSSCYEILS